MDCTEVDTKRRRNVTARCLKQVREELGYSAPMQPSLHRMIEHTVESVFLIYVTYVCSLHTFSLVIGATGES